MGSKPTTIDEYLAGVSDEQRAVLERLRRTIRATAPKAEEYIGYGLAAFRLAGRPLVAFGATPGHCAFYPMSGAVADRPRRHVGPAGAGHNARDRERRDSMFRTGLIAAALLLTGCAPSDTPAAAVGSRVAVNGMQMYYEVSGQGDPLIVLHGAYMNIPSMGAIIPRLAQTHKVYALEFQGHGRTTDIDRPITYQNLADDVAAFMDAVGLGKADVFGYSMGAITGLQLAIRHPEKVNKFAAASVAYDLRGWQPAFTAVIPQMTVEMIVNMPFAEDYRKLAPNPDGFPELARKLIALEKKPMAWEAGVKALKTPVLIIAGDADVATLEHSVAMFRLLGGGIMGDMGQPLPASRLAILPATSHTAVITQPDLLYAFIEPFLKGETPKGFFESP